jgi:sulfide dehydrogenase cytochrome subunit
MKRMDCLVALTILCLSASAAPAIEIAPAGAAACSGCNPPARITDTPFTHLAGRNPADILIAMQEFRDGKRPATVMDRISKGFTDDEIKAIAAWYAAQKD